ncbi:hypothetical protein NC315_38470 [Streptomyces sp. G2]|uniref:hypothetical protein n=1 Tax=Streptomyces TaxID=1883 RepID=UPI0020302F17|nr:hypothetical protein [Streptomyces sp. G2]MCM1951194.1 hypothetical protein [Streptomyces sp. G2]
MLVLGACGTAKATGGESASTAVAPAAAPAKPMGSLSSPALAEIQEYIAQTCPAPGTPREGPPNPQPAPPGEEAPAGMVEPVMPTAGPEVELNARDWCASNHHEQRIYVAVQKLTDPTPAKVRAALNGLGYPDERIHALKQSGATTQFFLDLCENGGRLCLEGSVGGEEPVVDKCVAPATGPFTAGRTQH